MRYGRVRCGGWGLLALVSWVVGGCESTADETYRVLFVGNSRIYYYNQPAMLEQIARANGRRVETRMVVEGGATIEDLIRIGALDTLRDGSWDAVVLNEQSTWGIARFVEGQERVPEAPPGFFARVDSFADVADAVGARLVLVAHPRHQGMPPTDGDALIRGFAGAARAHPSTAVVPLEVGWRVAAERTPRMTLYDPDGNHPTRVGALLSAVTTYSAIFGDVPEVVPSTIRGPWVELSEGILRPDSIVELVAVDSATALQLQLIASEAAERWPDAARRAQEPGVSDSGLPTLPAPEDDFDPAARGRWAGELRLYPARFVTWPASMTLVLHRAESRWVASLQVSFSEPPNAISYANLPVSDEGAYLQFVDPDGPNGGIVRYRIVPAGDSIVGVAEFLTDVDVYGIGSLTLYRSSRR
jgi:hypothetical protein